MPLWAAAWLRTHQQLGGLIPLSGIVFVARAAIENFGFIETNKPKETKETMGIKIPQLRCGAAVDVVLTPREKIIK